VCVFPGREGEEGDKRLQAFVENGDGFRLAELDFELRGPGDLFGTKQHGLPPLRIADLNRDADVLTEARHTARDLISADPLLTAPEHAILFKQVAQRYGKALDLGDVG
jgi:ATP-dependent DNA helicase RecG